MSFFCDVCSVCLTAGPTGMGIIWAPKVTLPGSLWVREEGVGRKVLGEAKCGLGPSGSRGRSGGTQPAVDLPVVTRSRTPVDGWWCPVTRGCTRPHTCVGSTEPHLTAFWNNKANLNTQTDTFESSLTPSKATVNEADFPQLSGWTDYRARNHLPEDNCLNSPLHFARIETVPISRSLSD